MAAYPAYLSIGVVLATVGCIEDWSSSEDPCLSQARLAGAGNNLGAALAAISSCDLSTAAVAVERASLLYRLGHSSTAAWAHAFERASLGADSNLTARSALALAQTSLEAGAVNEAARALARLEKLNLRVSPKMSDNQLYVAALVAKGRGEVQRAHEQLESLAARSGPIAVLAASAQANLWGQTGRARRAFERSRAILEGEASQLSDAARAHLLHNLAWNGTLVLEDQLGRGLAPSPDHLTAIESASSMALALFRGLHQNSQVASLHIEQAWRSRLLNLVSTASISVSSETLDLRDRGYWTLLEAEKSIASGDPSGAKALLKAWLDMYPALDPDVSVRAHFALARLGAPGHGNQAWIQLGRMSLVSNLLGGWSDVLGRHHRDVLLDLEHRRRQGGRDEETFALLALWTGAPFRRLRIRMCLREERATLEPMIEAYWRSREADRRASIQRPALSRTGIATAESAARERQALQETLQTKIAARCAPYLARTWSEVVKAPTAWSHRFVRSLRADDRLVLPFQDGYFLASAKGVAFQRGAPDAPNRVNTSPRTWVVQPTHPASVGPTSYKSWPSNPLLTYLPDAELLSQLRREACTATGPPVIVADPRRNLPGARRAGRLLAEANPGAIYLEGPRATVARFRTALRNATWLAFGGHARAGQAPANVGVRLELADGEVEAVDALLDGKAPCLAVLLGCRTGTRGVQEDAFIGLVDALLAQGAQAVLTTTSDIRDDEAARLTEHLHLQGPGEFRDALIRALSALSPQIPELAQSLRLFGDNYQLNRLSKTTPARP